MNKTGRALVEFALVVSISALIRRCWFGVAPPADVFTMCFLICFIIYDAIINGGSLYFKDNQ
jgi:hypothetical protein